MTDDERSLFVAPLDEAPMAYVTCTVCGFSGFVESDGRAATHCCGKPNLKRIAIKAEALDEPGKPVEHFLHGTRYLGWYLLAATILGALWMLWEAL